MLWLGGILTGLVKGARRLYILLQKWCALIACFFAALVLPNHVFAVSNPQSDLAQIMSEGGLCRVPDSSKSKSQEEWLQSLYGNGFSVLLWTDRDRYDSLLTALADLKWDGLDPRMYAILQLE